jgi:hypothetical protein
MSDTRPSSIVRANPEAAGEIEKSTMVCRHWKSKGLCKLGSKCKFLHPEHKRGVSGATSGFSNSTHDRCKTDSGVPFMKVSPNAFVPSRAECPVPLAHSGGRRKRAGQKRSPGSQQEENRQRAGGAAREQTAQVGFDENNSGPQLCSVNTMNFPPLSSAPGAWLKAGGR